MRVFPAISAHSQHSVAQGVGRLVPVVFGEQTRMVAASPQLQLELERQIQLRTGRRIRQLSIELSPTRVVLHGQTTSYYLKQLAQHTICETLPQVTLRNDIVVESH
jgi:hypothetical protein